MSSSEPAEAGYREGAYFPRSLKQPDPPERDNPSAGHRHGRLATTLLGADARTVTEPLSVQPFSGHLGRYKGFCEKSTGCA